MFIAASLYLLATILYIVCGSGELEQWAIIDEPLPEIPERQNDNSGEVPKRTNSVRQSNARKNEDDQLTNEHRQSLSLKTGKRPHFLHDLANQQPLDGIYTMEYLNVPFTGNDIMTTNNSRRVVSDSGESNSSKRRSGSNYGSQSTTATTTTPVKVTLIGNDSNEFFDTVP